MSHTHKDRKKYFMKELWNNVGIFHNHLDLSFPSKFKRMERKRRRNKVKQALRNGEYDVLPKFKKEDGYNYW